jgi:hypothetical protein
MSVLAKAILAKGEIITFEVEKTRKIGRRYLIACSENDKKERMHRAKVMRDVSKIVIV